MCLTAPCPLGTASISTSCWTIGTHWTAIVVTSARHLPELPHSIQCDDWQPHPSSELVNVSELRHRLAPFPSLLSADFPLFCKFASFHLSHPTSLSGRNAFFASPKHTNRYVGPAQLASPDVQRALCTPWRTFQQPLLRRAGASPYRTPTAGHALYQ